jgi:YfiH family protein
MCASSLARAPGVAHAFFTRQGGVSEGVFASLNCGFGSGDDPGRVAENRARAAAKLGVAADALLTLYQTHSARVVRVDRPWAAGRAPKADGMATRVKGLAIGILSADCAPVLLSDAAAGVVGAAHAGWRGALAGVVEATVGAMRDLGARPERTVAGVGPCIRRDSYEVGPEFEREFVAADPANGRFFRAAPQAGRFLFDLAGYVIDRLARAGVAAVEDVAADTAADEERFYSYRRSVLRRETGYGRGLSAIALAP